MKGLSKGRYDETFAGEDDRMAELLDLILYIPVNNCSVISGQVFLR